MLNLYIYIYIYGYLILDLRTGDMIAHDLKGDTEDINQVVATWYLKLHVWENCARGVNHYVLNIKLIENFITAYLLCITWVSD